MKFKVGDRVRTENGTGIILSIIDCRSKRQIYAVEHDTWDCGHDFTHRPEYKGLKASRPGSGWFYWESDLTRITKYDPGDLSLYASFKEEDIEINIMEEQTMNLETIQKQNLKEAKKQYDEERSNAEITFAKQQLAELTDRKLYLVREMDELQKKLDAVNEQLKLFDKK